ncbi:MAG: T9SS type A sorting domain-containing protein [Lewinellaceae bacterium]|nr:T9SS type A sorting domain-containing protein [Saprospiraceae bacterium]MCB9330213.1 T9SS type A sorting domain-containing protein [Lewinellaceae bacterium]
MKHTCLCLIFSFLAFSQAFAQPKQIFLGDSGADLITRMIPYPDGHFLATGAKQIGANTYLWILKIDASGTVIWENAITPLLTGASCYGNGLTVLSDGSIIVSGEQRSDDVFNTSTAMAVKTAADGSIIWKRSYANVRSLQDAAPHGNDLMFVGIGDKAGSSQSGLVMLTNSTGILQWKLPVEVFNQTQVRRIFSTTDGKFLLVGRSNVIGVGFGGVFIQKIEPDGSLIWQKTWHADWDESHGTNNGGNANQPLGAFLLSDGSLMVVNPQGSTPDIALLHFSANGELLEQKIYGHSTIAELPYDLSLLPDNSVLITGTAVEKNVFPATYKGFAALIDPKGRELWRQYYGRDDAKNLLLNGLALSDGHFLLTGTSNAPAGHGGQDGWLLRAEADGNILPWKVEGRIIADLNGNCQEDPGEPPLSGWFVHVSNTESYYLTTDSSGRFTIKTDDGSMTITPDAPEPASAWNFCTSGQTVQSNAANPHTTLTFLAQAVDGGCPHTEVSLTQPDLVRCENSNIAITVQNRGAGESGDLLLAVQLDPALSPVSASEPFFQNGQSLEFVVPPMGEFEQKNIDLQLKLACDVQLSASHLVVARLTPVECAPVWNGPRFVVDGHCAGAEVQFLLKNEGGGGSFANTRYRVLADGFLIQDWTAIDLPEGEPAQVIQFPADGHSWRLELEQAAGFPASSRPAASIEACGKGPSGLHSIALVNAWPFDAGAPDIAAILPPNTTGVPDRIAEAIHGLGFYNFIDNAGWLEYTARLKNPLEAKLDQVEFQLTFSPNLDITSFQPVASNAPVQLQLEKFGLLRATMSNLQLDTADYAMLRFRIRPLDSILPDDGQNSLFTVAATAYANGYGPYSLSQGFNNYSKDFLLPQDPYNNYPPEILRFGGRSYDFGTFAVASADGAVFLSGETSSYSDRTNTDGLLVKTDNTGRAIWLTAIDLGDQGSNTFRAVAPLSDGGCMAAGNYRPPEVTSNNLSDYYPYIARLDANGHLLWHKKIRPGGAEYGAWAIGIIGTADGNFILFGYSANTSGQDQFYLKLSPDGAVIWVKTEEIQGSAFRPLRALALSDGSAVFMGSNESTQINFNLYLQKVDAGGNILWSKGYNGAHDVYAAGLAPTANGGFLVNGTSQWEYKPGEYAVTPTLIGLDSTGAFLWEKNPVIGPFANVRINNLAASPDGGFFSVGEILADTSDHFFDMFLLKTDENGDTLWWRNYGSKNTERVEDALAVPPNHLFLWGFNQPRPPLYDLQGVLVRTELNGDLSVGIIPEPQQVLQDITVYPNPARSQFFVQLPNEPVNPVQWALVDLSGQCKITGTTVQQQFSVAVQTLPEGVYVLVFPGQGLSPRRLVVLH